MPNDPMMQSQMPLQYTPDQPQSADMIEAQKLLDAGVAPQIVREMLLRGLIGGGAGAMAGGMAGGPIGAAIGGGLAGVAGAASGAIEGPSLAQEAMGNARMTTQMPPMPQYPPSMGVGLSAARRR